MKQLESVLRGALCVRSDAWHAMFGAGGVDLWRPEGWRLVVRGLLDPTLCVHRHVSPSMRLPLLFTSAPNALTQPPKNAVGHPERCKADVMQSVRNQWPILVIAGSGGYADVITNLIARVKDLAPNAGVFRLVGA